METVTVIPETIGAMMSDMMGTMMVIMVLGVLLFMVYFVTGNRRSPSFSVLVSMIVMMVIFLAIFPVVLDEFMFDKESECVEEGLVNCELYNIPLEGCERDVTEEGPYYDVRTVTKYTKFTCTRWDNGAVLQP